MTKQEKKEFMEQSLEFMLAVSKHLSKERGVVTYCECPLCGGTIKMSRAKCNGHFSAKCDKCGISAME